jgi:hypothetical protein
MALFTVGDYLKDVRTLLQDRIEPYRYSTGSLVRALNFVMLEVRRLRPDLFIGLLDNVPQYDWDEALDAEPGTDDDDDDNPTWSLYVPIEQSFRPAMIFGITGHAMARDQEDIEDERTTGHIMTFENMLTEVRSTKGKTAPKA